MYNHRSRGTESKPYPYDAFECSTYKLAGQKRSAACCGHHISTKALRELILETIRAASTFAISDRDAFLEKVRSASQLRQAEAAKETKRKLNKEKSGFLSWIPSSRSSMNPLPSGALPASGSTACWRNMRRSRKR